MLYPSVFHRVRMIGSEDEFVVARVDHALSIVDLCALSGQTAIERAVPFHQLYASAELDHTSLGSHAHDDRLAAADEIVRSSDVLLRQSHVMLADTMDLIAATMQIIRVTQGLIDDSDQTIARSMNSDGPKD